MKPSRSKREGRADRAREIQRGRRGATAAHAPPRSRGRRGPGAPPRSAACTSLGRGARDRLSLTPAEAGRVGWLRPSRDSDGGPGRRAYSPAALRRLADRGRDDGPRLPREVTLPFGPGRPGVRMSPAHRDRSRWRRCGRSSRPLPVSTASRRPGSAGDCREPCRPVLKTRTKESIGPASRRAAGRGPEAQREWRPAPVRPRRDPAARRPAHRRPATSPPRLWRRKSGHARTRKMVNYARAGRSQRKLWWRSAAILTCKSIVRLGYRGERLIEPSSSWFPPKFPSG